MQRNNFDSYYVIHADFGEHGSEAVVNASHICRDEVVELLVAGEVNRPWRIDHIDLAKGQVEDVSRALVDEAINIFAAHNPGEDLPGHLQNLDEHTSLRAIRAHRAEMKEAA